LDSERVRSDKAQIQYVLRRHFEGINQIPRFRASMKVFIPESNLANEASHMANMIKKLRDVRCFSPKQDRVGVHKSHSVTDDQQHTFNSKLKSDSLYFDYDFFTTSTGKTVKSIKAMAREQLERYHIEYQEAKDEWSRSKQVITGKMGSGMQDDLAIAILMGPYWSRIALKNKSCII
jgi:hypothetical protein